jgi:UDPglucose--hexose-1-phosphate uridylyltransferase
MATLSDKPVEEVLWAYRDRMLDLKNDRRFRYILLFKNHGEPAGASLEHTHSQLIALPIVPKRVREEVDNAKRYYDEKERCIFCDMIRQEMDTGTRMILENDYFLALAPYAPRFPFETWILPRQHSSAFENMPTPYYGSLAKVLREFLARLDTVLAQPSYNYVIHTSPIGEEINDHYHWHIEMMPKLTKVAGFEWGTHPAGRSRPLPPRRQITPQLRHLSGVLFRGAIAGYRGLNRQRGSPI